MKISGDHLSGVVLPIATAIVFCALWQAATIYARIPSVLLPAPTEIGRDFSVFMPELLRHGRVSGVEVAEAFFLATALGFLGAALLHCSPLLREMLYPAVIVFQLLPKVALAPLFIVWLGTDTASRLAFATFLSFFPVLIATLTGLQHTDANAVRLCRSLAATEWQIFFAIRLPFALPYFFSGLKVAATMSITGIIVAEFITAQAGLGYLILYSSSRMDTSKIFAAILMLCVIGLALYGGVTLIERLARRSFGR